MRKHLLLVLVGLLIASALFAGVEKKEPSIRLNLKEMKRYNDIRITSRAQIPPGRKMKKVLYYVGTIQSRVKDVPPELPFHIFLDGFKPGLQVLSVVIQLDDGSFASDSLGFFLKSDPSGKVEGFFKDRKKVAALMHRIFREYYRNRTLDLKGGAMANVLGKKFPGKPVGELNELPVTEKAMREYLARLQKQNILWEKFISANAKAYSAADKKWVNPMEKNFISLLNANGHNGRYFLAMATQGLREMIPNMKNGANFFFPYPKNTELVHQLGLGSEKDYAVIQTTLSRIPHPRHRKEFPRKRSRPGSRGDHTPEEIRLLAQRFPDRLMFTLSEWGGQQDWALYAGPRIPVDRLDCEQLFIDSQREFINYWLPKGTAVFAWDNVAVPGLQYEGGVDFFLTQIYRGYNMGISFASLRGDSKAYRKPFGTSITELSWLAATLDWGLADGENLNTFGGLGKATSRWAAIGRKYKPCYAQEDINKAYYYSYVSGATVIGHEGWGLYATAHPFINYMKRHPAMGLPENRIAVVRGQGGGPRIAPAADDARGTGIPAVYAIDATAPRDKKGFTDLSDWGYNTHMRDYGLMNIFFPGYGNSYFSRKQYTSAPYGPIDLLYGRAALSKKDHDFAFVISVNIMTKDQIAKWTKYVQDGGTLLINIEQCKGKNRRFNKETLAFLKEICGVTVGATLPEKDCRLVYKKKTIPAPGLILTKVIPLQGTKVKLTDGWGNPLLLERKVGKGKLLLTTSLWHWRIPQSIMEMVVKEETAKIPIYVKARSNADSMEFFANRLKDDSGIVISLFNNKVDHTALQHFRKIHRTEKRVLPGTAGKVFPILLPDNKDKKLVFAFPEGLDFRKYDEFVMTARVDGRKPGGSCNFIFTDSRDRKKTWKHGQIWVGRMLGNKGEYFTRWMSPAHKNYANVAPLVGDRDFNWKDVRKVEIVFNRCTDNPALDFNFHLKELVLQNLYWKERSPVRRSYIPFASTVEVDCKAMGIDPGKIRNVYSCGGSWEPRKIPFTRKGGKILFKGYLNGDFGQYLLSRKALPVKK